MTEETKPANENAAAKKQPEPSKNPESKKAAASKQKPSGFFRALKIMLLLCLITVISVGCWLGWAYWQAQIVSGDNSQQQLASLQDSVDSMQQQFSWTKSARACNCRILSSYSKLSLICNCAPIVTVRGLPSWVQLPGAIG